MKHVIRLIVFGVSIGAVPNAGMAQHRLDRNLQRGSGGINRQAERINYRARNFVITGNVAGGREFRDEDGTLGYVAAGAFSDQLGTDDLFRFRARSMSLGNLGRSGPSYTSLAPRPVFSGAPAISAGNIYDQRSRLLPTVQGRDAATATYGRSVASLSGTLLADAGRSEGTFTRIAKRDGTLLRLEASELRGLRAVPVRPDLPSIEMSDPDAVAAAVIPPEVGKAKPKREKQEGSEGPDFDDRAGDGAPGRLDKISMWTPSLEIGDQIMNLVEPQPADAKLAEAQFEQMEERIELIERVIFDPEKTKDAEPGDDVYLDMLKKLEAQMRGEPVTDEPDAADGPPDQPEQDGTDTEDRPDAPERVTLELPTAEKLLAARAARAREIGRRRELSKTVDGDANRTDMDELELPGHLGRLVKMLDHDLTPLGSMAGKSDTRVNELFRTAESQMAEGDFFRAEKSYQSILSYQADHPLATTGLIHAQLGFGKIRTAASTLRQHFARHPEVMATRYQSKLLPGRDRLRWATRRIERLIDLNERVEPPLMLAYLGYQTNSPRLVRYGLDLAQSRRPRDPLLPLLRRIWLNDAEKKIAAGARPAPMPSMPPIPQTVAEKGDAESPARDDEPVDADSTAPPITK